MNSSGIKRGLATTAIAALAITGVPAIANATPLAVQETAATSAVGVTLHSVAAGESASVRPDGTNSTISLVATGGSSVENVTFAYNGIVIATVGRSASGDFQTEWTPPVGVVAATITATRTDAAGAVPVAPAPLNDGQSVDSEAITVSGTAASVEIAPKAQLGYFVQPGAAPDTAAAAGGYFGEDGYVSGVSGTTSLGAGAITVVNGRGLASGGTATTNALPAGANSQTWNTKVEVDAGLVDSSATDNDQVEIVARTGAAAAATTTRDAQGFNLYKQDIASIAASAAPLDGTSNTTNVTVVVKDGQGNPVAGAHIDGTGPNGPLVDAFTDGNGEYTYVGVPAGSYNFWVDRTNVAGFTNGFDFQTSTVIGAAVPSSIDFVSQDGNTFDLDEYAAGNTRVQVKDAAGNPLSGQTFFYSWTYTPFVPNATTNKTKTFTGQVVTNAQGFANVPLPAGDGETIGLQGTAAPQAVQGTGGSLDLSGYVNVGTNPGQDPADLAFGGTTVKVGESVVDWDGTAASTDRQSGSEQSFSGTVKLADGTALAGRTLNVTYAPAANSSLSATQPSGTTRLSNTAARVVTAADGSFAVNVTDPSATPQVDETGNTLTATGTATVGTGADQKEGIGTDATDQLTVNFRADAAPRFITAGAVSEADFGNALGNGLTPGRPATFNITLTNSAGVGLVGQQVTLKTSNGFFTPNASATSTDPSRLTPAPAAAEGGQVGEWATLGDEITVTTGAGGVATVTVAIEKDAGFDDDGRVVANITATSGQATNTNPITVDFRTDDSVEPLNPGSVSLEEAANNGIDLPDARVGQAVRYNLFATDQFGNLVADQVNISDNTLDATFTNEGTTGVVVSQFANSGAAIQATANAETDQILTATWNQASTVYTDASAATPGFQPSIIALNNTSKSDAADAINWYVVDFAASTFSLSTEPEGDVAVGAPIVETVTVLDQLGKPVPGLQVAFVRQGPGDTSGDPNAALTTTTNANGQAFYAFTGTEPGIARVSAAVTDGTQVQTLSDEITIVPNNGGGERVPVEALIAGDNNGGRKDVIRFQVDEEAEGATVRLFKITGKGDNRRTRQIRSDIVPEGGELTFKVADRNGNKVTRYVAKVSPTDASLREKSNTQKIR